MACGMAVTYFANGIAWNRGSHIKHIRVINSFGIVIIYKLILACKRDIAFYFIYLLQITMATPVYI